MKVKELEHPIMGTNVPQVVCYSDKFPKLEVTLYQAPSDPERIIAHNYMECIEDANIKNPNEISLEKACAVTQWVLKGGHTPALESIYLGFNVKGMSKVVSHQLVRHRIGVSIGQRTQRANSESYLGKIFDCNHFVTPPSISKAIKDDIYLLDNYRNYYKMAQNLYNQLIDYGISEDDARYIIPQASETSMDFNIIYKSLLHVCQTRMCLLMQGEMVEIVRMMANTVKYWNVSLGDALKPLCLVTGKCNRNENNPTEKYPKGVCHMTQNNLIPVRDIDNTYDLTKYSKDVDK